MEYTTNGGQGSNPEHCAVLVSCIVVGQFGAAQGRIVDLLHCSDQELVWVMVQFS